MQSQLGERRLRRRQTGLVIRETGAGSSEGGEGRGHFGAEAMVKRHLVATHEQTQSNVLLWLGIHEHQNS